MSDNTVLPPGFGGDTIRTIDRGGAKREVMAIDLGGELGPENLLVASTGLPVVPVGPAVWSVAQSGPWVVTQGGVWTVAISNFPAATTSVSVNNFPLSGSGNLLVDASIAGVDLGPALMETSLPVTLAQDQDIPIRATGQQPMAQSVAVTLASDQPALPINFPSSVLVPNVAQELGGNLSTLVAIGQYLQTSVELQRQTLSELRALNLQLASITGVSVPVALDDDQITLQ